jgi:hypothetical protein
MSDLAGVVPIYQLLRHRPSYLFFKDHHETPQNFACIGLEFGFSRMWR